MWQNLYLFILNLLKFILNIYAMIVLCRNLFEIVCFKCKTGAIGASGEQGMNKICCLV